MIVDDSAVIRGLITRWLSEEADIVVVGSAGNGALALKQLVRLDPEVLVLDVEMPEMDGLTALPKMLGLLPDLKIVMVSTLTARNADVSLRALAAGAADYVPKPGTGREMQGAPNFRADLIAKVRALGQSSRLKSGSRRRNQNSPALPLPPSGSEAAGGRVRAPQPCAAKVVLRPASRSPAHVLAIGSSTGGPQALFSVLGALKGCLELPVLVTQHMPPTFTAILAEHLHRQSGVDCHEALDGEPVLPGRVYLAPGDWHMRVQERDGRKYIQLDQEAPENFCRPSVDPMLRSLCRVYGAHVLAIILTGMGSDGYRGCQAVVEAGGNVIAQDEASSVVWGMPGVVASAGLCSAVLPLQEIAPAVRRLSVGVAA
ncbi:MAG: chemotaxis response regulator protein-glutamate methylesterase [Alphaproteobacteria bacterium]|nr:chemotaxis response regulator protein-glutamate methylesterase [Alphaproteobacteria bacterium]